ncbi:MAG: hypothetical protein ACTHNU_08315 [Gaiellales bacterium]
MDEPDFDLVAASLRADTVDMRAFAEALAVKLEQALPGMVAVERHGGLFSRDKQVRAISATFGEQCYRLEVDGGRVEASRRRAVRGIVLHTEELGLDEWIDGLSRELTAAASTSEQSRAALARMLGAS